MLAPLLFEKAFLMLQAFFVRSSLFNFNFLDLQYYTSRRQVYILHLRGRTVMFYRSFIIVCKEKHNILKKTV